jgi:protoporphyrinogen oxidase
LSDPGRTIILGAGPTGLGAAYRLRQIGFRAFTLLEAGHGPGGLASSVVDPSGFTWDLGGHVQFSHYRYYDDALDRALGREWLEHEREAWVWFRDRFVPYPFQNNLHRLDAADVEPALAGLEEAARRADLSPPRDFRQWIARTFGSWIAEHFLYPYNAKVWGHPLEEMGVGWVGERVAAPDLERIRRNLEAGRDDVAWGPNRRFRFPRRGGTGAIWKAVTELLGDADLRFGADVVAVDLRSKRLTLATGEWLAYDTLISSMPLDRLSGMCRDLDPEARQAARAFRHSSCHILGVGVQGPKPEALRTKCWMYFPDPAVPYYRVTVFSNYSPFNVPPGDHWSLMAEVCESPTTAVDSERLASWTLEGMRRDGLLASDSRVVSLWHRRLEYGYPIPTLDRDAALGRLFPELERHRVYSRGRFGAWKYEVSNQDHSFMQGVELIDRLFGLGEEHTLERPHYVNSGVFAQPPAQARP